MLHHLHLDVCVVVEPVQVFHECTYRFGAIEFKQICNISMFGATIITAERCFLNLSFVSFDE